MAVAHYKMPNGNTIGPRQMYAPSDASLRGWWNSARKAISELPLWSNIKDSYRASYDEEAVHFSWFGGDLFIARKRNMR